MGVTPNKHTTQVSDDGRSVITIFRDRQRVTEGAETIGYRQVLLVEKLSILVVRQIVTCATTAVIGVVGVERIRVIDQNLNQIRVAVTIGIRLFRIREGSIDFIIIRQTIIVVIQVRDIRIAIAVGIKRTLLGHCQNLDQSTGCGAEG